MLRFLLAGVIPLLTFAQTTQTLGIFEDQSDVGKVVHSGDGTYDPASKSYTLSGSGENMWFAKDEFHFVWRKISANNLSLAADISVLGGGGDAHRKGVLMIRQSLDQDAAYVDAARHGEGLTSLQYRDKQGATTREVESNVSGPLRLRIEKRGDVFYLWIGAGADSMQFSGGSARVELHAPFYIGLGVCAHNKDAVEKVMFSNVELSTSLPHRKTKYSTVQTVLLSGDARSGYVSTKHLTSPGWSADGQSLTYVSSGVAGHAPFTPLRTAAPVGPPVAKQSGNDQQYFQSKSDGYINSSPHLSPDGKYLVFLSRAKKQKHEVTLRLMTVATKSTKDLVTFTGSEDSLGPDPWSPDGKRIVFVSYQRIL